MDKEDIDDNIKRFNPFTGKYFISTPESRKLSLRRHAIFMCERAKIHSYISSYVDIALAAMREANIQKWPIEI